MSHPLELTWHTGNYFDAIKRKLNKVINILVLFLLLISFIGGDGFFLPISYFADPLYSFSILIPLAAGMDTVLATDMLMVTVMAEWSNTLLKW